MSSTKENCPSTENGRRPDPDEVLRRMLNTPPKPRKKAKAKAKRPAK